MSSRVYQISGINVLRFGAAFRSSLIRLQRTVKKTATAKLHRSLAYLQITRWQLSAYIFSKPLQSILIFAIIPVLLITQAVPALSARAVVNPASATPVRAVVQAAPKPPQDTFALKGINIGNDQSSTSYLPYKAAQNEADLAYLKGKVSRVRIAVPYGLDTHDLTNLKRLAIEAKDQGFYVQFGITAGSDPDVTTYYNQWLSTDIINTAMWAQAHHIDEFSIGNEEDWYCQMLGAFTAKTPEAIRDDVRAEVGEVRKVYSGSIVYADSEGTIDDWIKEGIGGLDRIYFNVYDTLPNFQAIIQKIVNNFGTNHGGLAEWAAEHGYAEMIHDGMTDKQYTQEMMRRAVIVKASGLPAYLFTLRMDAGGNGWEFMLGDGTKRPGLDEVLAS